MKTRKFTIILLLLFTLFGASSCLEEYYVNGNRSMVTEDRYARNFDRVSSSGEFIINIEPGDEFSVEIYAESNLMRYIETDVINHTLKIRTRSMYNLRNHEPMQVNIICPELKSVNLSGSGRITTGLFICDGFNADISGSGDIEAYIEADHVDSDVSGSGEVILEGIARETSFKISGSGKIHAYDLETETCDALVSGSGAMYINVSDYLEASISGSGKIFFVGNPSVHTHISGSGEVVDRN